MLHEYEMTGTMRVPQQSKRYEQVPQRGNFGVQDETSVGNGGVNHGKIISTTKIINGFPILWDNLYMN